MWIGQGVVFYDVETTGLDRSAQIVSIGAVTQNGETFHIYIVPTCNINRRASEVHGIYKQNGHLFKDGILIRNALDPHSGLSCFMGWLESQSCKILVKIPINIYFLKSSSLKKIFQVAHNNFGFDGKVLKSNMDQFGVRRPVDCCTHLVDSLLIMRRNLIPFNF